MKFARQIATLLVCSLLFAGPTTASSQRIALNQPGTPLTVYASVQGVGIFKTSGASGLWQGPYTLTSTVFALATVNPDHWRILYAGLRNTGVYVSMDGGETWTPTSLHNRSVYTLLVDARNPNLVVAGTDRGIFRSDDGGATWASATGITRTVKTLAQAPAATSPGATTMYAGGSGRVWMSVDGGATWSQVATALPHNAVVMGIALGATQPVTVFAATSQGLYQTGGKAWTAIGRSLPTRPLTSIVADAGHMYAAVSGDAALYTSQDAGSTWLRRPITGFTGVTALVQDPQQPLQLVAGDSNGDAGFSADGGLTWSVSVGAVAGTVGSPVTTLALIHRQAVPSDGVPDPHRADVRWFPHMGGHTLRGSFLNFWQSLNDPTSILGYPASEEFVDQKHGGSGQMFDHMELIEVNGMVAPAPLGLEQAPTSAPTCKPSCAVDPTFQAFWGANGGATLFGQPVTTAFKQPNGDGTGRLFLVQYFRNARLEYHPELSGAGATVLVGALGHQALQALGWTPSNG